MKTIYWLKLISISSFIVIASINGTDQLQAQVLSSPEFDKTIGAEMVKEVEQQMGIYDAPLSTDYIRAIGERLAANLEDNQYDFRFQIVDQWESNAFAVPGGYVFFSRGLLILANEEGELAGILGHEISHVTQRHSARQMERNILPGLLSIPGNLIGLVNEDLGNLINVPIDMIGQVSIAKYSRKQESEADKLGMRLAAKSGYDPELLAVSLAQLQKDVEMITQSKHEFSYFDTHPTTSQRVSDIHTDLEQIQWDPQLYIAKNRADFLRRLDGLYYGESPAQGVFHGQQFLHPDLNFSITFPENWKTTNSPSSVGAYLENKEAMVFIDGIGTAADPEKLGKAFIEKLEKEHKTKPESAKQYNIDSWPGYLVILVDESSKEPAHAYYLWVTMKDLTYQLIGAGADRYKEELRKTAYSLRPLTSKERNSITGTRLRIATAKSGESLSELGQRTGNVWSPSYTAMVNSIPENRKLEKGKLIKIAKEEPYRRLQNE